MGGSFYKGYGVCVYVCVCVRVHVRVYVRVRLRVQFLQYFPNLPG